ncbi:desiccation-related protein PCC13-62-like [Populus alba x Populus x berolinensis]|nr:desiccation-related protein PCC13-62-like [Populus alba x Populus x berolinensis]
MAVPSLLATAAFLLVLKANMIIGAPYCGPVILASDFDLVQVALNLEFLEAEFFLIGANGEGLDTIAPNLAQGGPPPIGARKANLDDTARRIIQEFGFEEVGHIRAISSRIGGFPRPQLNLSSQSFATMFDQAVGFPLVPPFDPYANTINYLLASYLIPYVGLVGYVGTIPSLVTYNARSLVASLLGVEAGQDAVIRTLLYNRANETVVPYNLTVAEFTIQLSNLKNRLAGCGNKDEGLIVPPELGAENRTTSNILSADGDSLSYARNAYEIFRIIYGTGNEHRPGGFLPRGGNGKIAKGLLIKA